jgi:methyl-accepting chemotaxis protein/DNA-binding LacI/PurR family transcriptional regulator
MSAKARPAIGILLNDPVVYATYMRLLWEGAMAAAEEEGADLLCFQGREAEKSTRHLPQNVTLFSQLRPEVIDGLVVVGMTEQALWERIPAAGVVPTVTVQPSHHSHLVADNRSGMRSAVEHLLRDHGRRRLAFVRGIAGERGAEERHGTYCEVLREHGLPLDPALVVQGDYCIGSGVAAVEELVARRRVEFDAVVAANDLMAFGVLQGLATHGRKVPAEVSVVGFDDMDKAAFCEPPLTTVHQPLQQMGARAVQKVLGALRGQRLEQTEVVPTRLVVRRSCGCLPPSVRDAYAVAPPVGRLRGLFTRPPTRAALEAALLAALRERGARGPAGWTVEWGDRLGAALACDLHEGSTLVLDTVEELVRDLVRRGHPSAAGQDALTAFRGACLPALAPHPGLLARAEGLWQQARVLVDAEGQRPYVAAQASFEGLAETIESMVRSLATQHGVRGLMEALRPRLGELHVTDAYVVLHDGPARPAQRSRLVLAYRDGQAAPLAPAGEIFETAQLLPARFHVRPARRSLLVTPLFYSFADNDQLGYTVLDLTRADMRGRAVLAEQLAVPVKNALVVEDVSAEVARRKAVEDRAETELQAFLEAIRALAEGDLTLRCLEGEGTLGRIGRSVNRMIERFTAILTDTREAARSVSVAASRILGAAGDISRGAAEGGDQVHAMMAAVHEMAASMDEVARHADASAHNAAVVNEHARSSDLAMEAAYRAITRLDAAIQETAGNMRQLEGRIGDIFGTVGAIDRIAQQARLLSLNAAIQASRAGEAGRGFAVVADELGRLTETTAAATRSIALNLDAVRSETSPVTEALARALHEAQDGSSLSEQVRRSLHEITQLIDTLAQAAAQIAKASREQTLATETVARGMETVAGVSTESTSSAAETGRAVQHLVGLSRDLDQAIARFKIDGRGAAPAPGSKSDGSPPS